MFQVVQETFNLTNGEKLLLLEASVGEGLLFAGTDHAAIKVVGSYLEHRIATSNPEELAQLAQEQSTNT